jgi:hypothetical protein
MTSLDNVFVPLATNMLNQFGATATFRKITRTFDPATRKNTVSRKNTTVKMKPPEPYNVNRINGTTIQAGDLTTMISGEALTFVPTTNDLIAYLGTDWQIVTVSPIVSGDSTAAYELQLRQ